METQQSIVEAARATGENLGKDIQEILGEWANLTDEVAFPEEVVFSSGDKLDSMKRNVMAGAYAKGKNEGELVPVVRTSGLEPDLLFKVEFAKPYQSSEGKVVYTKFPPDFYERCRARNLEPREVIGKAISETVWQDAVAQSKGEKRDKVHFTDHYVGILKA